MNVFLPASHNRPLTPVSIAGVSATLAQGPEHVSPVSPEVRPAPGEADLGDVPGARELS